MCGGPDIPEQDPRFAEASLRQIALSEQMYKDYSAPGGDREWQRGLADEALGIYRQQADNAQRMTNYQLDNMRRNDDRYWNVGVPYEDGLLRDVDAMNTEAYREQQVATARNDVQQGFANAEQQGIRQMARMGVNPMSGAAAKMWVDGGRSKALALASASNKTRQAAMQMGLANKMQLYGGMKGLSGLGATSAQLALGASGQANGSASGITGTGAQSIGLNNSTFAASQNGVSGGISGYSQLYNGAANAGAAATNAQGEMIGAGIGAVGTIGAAVVI